MMLPALITLYIDHKRALGYRFQTEEAILRSFCRAVGESPLAKVEAESVLAFVNGNGPVTAYWGKKYHVIWGLYGCERKCWARVPARFFHDLARLVEASAVE